MNIPKISANSLSFGRIRPNALIHAVNSYNRRMGVNDKQYLNTVKKLALKQATNYRYDIDYSSQDFGGYAIIDNRSRKVLPIDRPLSWLDEACAVADFNNDRAMRIEKETGNNDYSDTDAIKRDIYNIAGIEFNI